MDSMRSLDTSLPSSSGRHIPPEQLLQAFRSAALSVTNLYKSAVTDQSNNRRAGYQDALDDLLAFLDRGNLGLQDGEGWKVRQWATARLEHRSADTQHNDSDDERGEPEKQRRSTSPAGTETSTARNRQRDMTRSASPAPVDAEAPIKDENNHESPARPPMFRFGERAQSHEDIPMQNEDNTLLFQQADAVDGPNSVASSPLRVEIVNRATRAARHGGNRGGTRSATRDFNFTAGTKRKVNFTDFFDISNLGPGRDGAGGGGKRGRFV